MRDLTIRQQRARDSQNPDIIRWLSITWTRGENDPNPVTKYYSERDTTKTWTPDATKEFLPIIFAFPLRSVVASIDFNDHLIGQTVSFSLVSEDFHDTSIENVIQDFYPVGLTVKVYHTFRDPDREQTVFSDALLLGEYRVRETNTLEDKDGLRVVEFTCEDFTQFEGDNIYGDTVSDDNFPNAGEDFIGTVIPHVWGQVNNAPGILITFGAYARLGQNIEEFRAPPFKVRLLGADDLTLSGFIFVNNEKMEYNNLDLIGSDSIKVIARALGGTEQAAHETFDTLIQAEEHYYFLMADQELQSITNPRDVYNNAYADGTWSHEIVSGRSVVRVTAFPSRRDGTIVLQEEATLIADVVGYTGSAIPGFPDTKITSYDVIRQILLAGEGVPNLFSLSSAQVDLDSLLSAINESSGDAPSTWLLSRRFNEQISFRDVLAQAVSSAGLRMVFEDGQVRFFPKLSSLPASAVIDLDTDDFIVAPTTQSSTRQEILANKFVLQYRENPKEGAKTKFLKRAIQESDFSQTFSWGIREAIIDDKWIRDATTGVNRAIIYRNEFSYPFIPLFASLQYHKAMALQVGDIVRVNDLFSRYSQIALRIIQIDDQSPERINIAGLITNPYTSTFNHEASGSRVRQFVGTQRIEFTVNETRVAVFDPFGLRLKGVAKIEAPTVGTVTATGLITYLSDAKGDSIAISVRDTVTNPNRWVVALRFFENGDMIVSDMETIGSVVEETIVRSGYVYLDPVTGQDVLLTGDKMRTFARLVPSALPASASKLTLPEVTENETL